MQIVPNFRVRTIPVLGTMPAIFGMAAASYILCQLAQLPFHPEPIFKLVEGQYETQLQRLTEREDLVYGNSEGPAVDLDDVRPPLCATCVPNAVPSHLQASASTPLAGNCEVQTKPHCEGGLLHAAVGCVAASV